MKVRLYQARLNYCVDEDWNALIYESECCSTKEEALRSLYDRSVDAVTTDYNVDEEVYKDWMLGGFSYNIKSNWPIDGEVVEVICNINTH